MNPAEFGSTALRRRDIDNPLSPASLDRIIALCNPPARSRVLDVGCGKGEFLLRLAQSRTIRGEGIDLSEGAIRFARARAEGRVLRGALTFRRVDARAVRSSRERYFLTSCLGATHAFGDLGRTLRTLRRWTQTDGWIVVGEGFWKRVPKREYLDVLGATPSELRTDRGNVRVAEGLGLQLAEHWSASEQEWDDFEDAYLEGIESYAREHPEDPNVAGNASPHPPVAAGVLAVG